MNKSKKNVGFCRAKIVTKYYITVRELPKGDSFRFVCGIQLRFANLEERRKMQEYVMYVKKRYKL